MLCIHNLDQARSQDLEKGGGGYFERVRKVQTTLTQIFIVLNQFHMVCPKIQTKFLGKLGNSKIFSAQNQVASKKKKRSSPNLRLIFRPKSEIQRFFPPKIRWSSKKKKKKKRSSPKLRLIFRPNSEIQTFEGGLFSYGGAIFNFSQKIGLKNIKNVQFCILHKPMGGLAPPPPRPPWLRY